jgi:hypothetical protein
MVQKNAHVRHKIVAFQTSGLLRNGRTVVAFFATFCVSFVACLPTLGQQTQGLRTDGRKLYRIEVEDEDEAALIQQELKLQPALVRGQSFYYYGDEQINKKLAEFDYHASAVDPDEIFTRVVRIVGKAEETALRDLGATVILRERGYLIIRATPKQLRTLSRLGYKIEELGAKEPQPRRVRLAVSTAAQVAEVGALRVDIDTVQKGKEGNVILGDAFDDVIDELRARGFNVQILPDYPGVTR